MGTHVTPLMNGDIRCVDMEQSFIFKTQKPQTTVNTMNGMLPIMS